MRGDEDANTDARVKPTSFTGVTYSLINTRKTKRRSSEEWRSHSICVHEVGLLRSDGVRLVHANFATNDLALVDPEMKQPLLSAQA